MLTIQSTSDITQQGQSLSPLLLAAASQELSQLREMLNFEDSDTNFRLDTIGYSIVCLGNQEPLSNLSELGLTFPFLHVEYVEIHDLQGVQYYRILIMYDNECFTTIFTVRGSQNAKLEEWLADQAIQGEAEYQ